MEKTVDIFGYAITFNEVHLGYDTNKPMSQGEAIELLHTVKKLFNETGLEYYLAFGTLLGAVRDHGIIPGDEDLDIVIKDEKLLLSIIPFLKDNGLFLIRACQGNVYSFRQGENSYIDVYILRELPWYSPWSWYCYSVSNREYNLKALWQEFQEIDFLGETHLCPKNPENILAFWYGDDWRTPKQGHCFYYEVKSHYYTKQIKEFIKNVIGYNYWRRRIKKQH